MESYERGRGGEVQAAARGARARGEETEGRFPGMIVARDAGSRRVCLVGRSRCVECLTGEIGAKPTARVDTRQRRHSTRSTRQGCVARRPRSELAPARLIPRGPAAPACHLKKSAPACPGETHKNTRAGSLWSCRLQRSGCPLRRGQS